VSIATVESIADAKKEGTIRAVKKESLDCISQQSTRHAPNKKKKTGQHAKLSRASYN
jgi:hypothetical protein